LRTQLFPILNYETIEKWIKNEHQYTTRNNFFIERGKERDMNTKGRQIIKWSGLLTIFLVLTIAIAACEPEQRLEPTPLPQVPGTGEDFSVEIINSTFQPDELHVPVGATVVWIQHDDIVHTVTADDGSFNSGMLGLGDVFTHTFDQAGEYVYHCEIHGEPGGVGMSGVIIVSDE
jgi:plastocyanin